MLPEKWYVVRTKENHKELNKYENDRQGDPSAAHMSDKAYFFKNKRYSSSSRETEGYTEISWEQFQMEVLNKNFNHYEIY